MRQHRNLVIFIISLVVFLLTLAVGIWRVCGSVPAEMGRALTDAVITMHEGWTYTTSTNPVPRVTALPAKLPLSSGDEEIVLTGRLPQTPVFGGVLRFGVMFQQAEIYIDGSLRASYGNKNAPTFNFPYQNAAHYMTVNLEKDDFGKTLSIRLCAPSFFSGELSVVRAPQVANHGTYVLAALVSPASNPIVSMMGLMLCVVLLCVAFTLWQKRGYAPGLLGFVGLTLLWVLFYLSDSLLLWEVFSTAPVFSAANDTKILHYRLVFTPGFFCRAD